MLAHQQKRLRFVAIVHPLQRKIRDQVGHVPFVSDFFAIADHRRVVVDSLARQDVPVVETGRLASEVPFPDQRRLVARFPK